MRRAAPAPRVIAVVGPTAAGKSDLGVVLAQQLGGEVVNADSMQLYRGMDIGTAKLTTEERDGVPHHLLDIWDVTETASVAEYQQPGPRGDRPTARRGPYAGPRRRLRAVRPRRDRRPGVPRHRPRRPRPAGGRSWPLRGPGALHARLAAADPAAAQAILPSNGRRIVRALEVIEITGRPFTANLPGHESVYDTVQIGVDVGPARARRADRAARGPDVGGRARRRGARAGGARDCATGAPPPARSATSRCSPRSPGSAPRRRRATETVRATKRFARRQDSWFRRDPRVHWLSGAAADRGELPDRR